VLLVGFGGEKSFGEPAAFDSRDDVPVVKEVVDVLLKNGASVDTVVTLVASNGVKTPVSMQNWKPSMGRRAPAGAKASQLSWMMRSNLSLIVRL